MTQEEVLAILHRCGAVLTGGHFVYASGKHGEAYVNKDAVYPFTGIVAQLCEVLARHFAEHEVDVVVGPAIGGVILSQWVTHYITMLTNHTIHSVYAEKSDDGYALTRGYDKYVVGKRVLVVEDVLTTGGSATRTIEVVRAAGGEVIGVGALCNRGGVTKESLANVPELFALVEISLEMWPEEDCPLCRRGVTVNTNVGKGRDFLARKQQGQSG